MIEAVVADEALGAARAVGHAVDAAQVGLTVVDPAAGRPLLELGGRLGGLDGAGVGRGVRRQEAVVPARLAAFGARAVDLEALAALEHLEHLGHRLRTVAGGGGEQEPDPVGFHLVLATVALHPGLCADVGELRHGSRTGVERRGERAERGENALSLALLRMLLRDMRDLVADHRGELGLGVQVQQQAAMQIDEAATGGEGVDGVVVEHDEHPLGIRQRAAARDALTEFVDVVLQPLVGVDAIGLEDLLVRLPRGGAGLRGLRGRHGRGHDRERGKKREQQAAHAGVHR